MPLTRLAEPPRLRALREEVLAGLAETPKTLPTRLLYDAAGSELFSRITTLPEYYLTRVEMEILERAAPEVARLVGPDALVIEPGSGDGVKARLLLGALDRPRAFVPIDVAESQLQRLAEVFGADLPGLRVHPVFADYSRGFDLPVEPAAFRRTLVFFPGSTIGNFSPEAATDFLAMCGRIAGPEGAMILGVDLLKAPRILEPAYDDAAGVTAEFNRNVLRHLNRELSSDFDLRAFRHHAPWVPAESRMEMHLVSLRDQIVRIPSAAGGSHRIELARDEPIVTEHSYKHSPEVLERLATRGGWRTTREWRDAAGWYSVRFLERPETGR